MSIVYAQLNVSVIISSDHYFIVIYETTAESYYYHRFRYVHYQRLIIIDHYLSGFSCYYRDVPCFASKDATSLY